MYRTHWAFEPTTSTTTLLFQGEEVSFELELNLNQNRNQCIK